MNLYKIQLTTTIVVDALHEMISFALITVLFIILLVILIFYITSLYYANYFIAYRPTFNIITKSDQPIDRPLSFSEYFVFLNNLYPQYQTI